MKIREKKSSSVTVEKVLSLIVALIAAGTPAVPARGAESVRLEELVSFGEEGPGILYQWVGLTTDESGAIYVTDLKDFSLKKYDPRGRFLKKAGRRGQGPGEFQSPGLVRYFQGLLYVSQIQHPGILIFDRDLNFRDTLSLNLPATDFQIIEDGRLAASFIHSGSLRIYDLRGKRREEIIYDGADELLKNSVAFVHDKDHYYLGYKWQDKILGLSSDGTISWTKSLLTDRASESRSLTVGGFTVPRTVFYKSVALSRDRKIFVLGGDRSENVSRDVYIFSRSGEWVDTVTLASPSHMIHIDADDHLFARSEQGTRVIKYKIRWRGAEDD